RVALIERAGLGGDCLNVGCVPSKTLLAAASSGLTFALALKRVRAVRAAIAVHDSVERYTAAGVDVFLGQASCASAREIRGRVAAALLRDGVRLRLGVRVASAGRTDAGKTLRLADGTQVVADEVLVAAGRTRNVAELRLERAGVRADPTSGIAVNARLQTSHP